MIALGSLAHLDDFDAPAEVPLFPVEAPDGMKHLSELSRQATFIKLMRTLAPDAVVWANANAGKRARHIAAKEGIRAGVPDVSVAWRGGIAFPEMKGYDKSGRPGKLSPSQVHFCNLLHARGHSVACFFSPMRAVEWLRECGCPVRSAS